MVSVQSYQCCSWCPCCQIDIIAAIAVITTVEDIYHVRAAITTVDIIAVMATGVIAVTIIASATRLVLPS